MSRKHYVELAKIIRDALYLTAEQKRILANQIGCYLQTDNPNFKPGKFTAAATESMAQSA